LYGKVGVLKMKPQTSKFTEDMIPVKGINNGTIILDNNEKVTGVKVAPKNIFILDESSQAGVIKGLEDFYNTIDYEFWLIVADRPVDINVYLSNMQLLYNEQQDPIKRKIIMQDINKANQFLHNNVVDTEFYILFKERDDEKCQKRIRNMISGLAAAGLNSQQTSNEDLRIILDNFLNGGKSSTFGTVIG